MLIVIFVQKVSCS